MDLNMQRDYEEEIQEGGRSVEIFCLKEQVNDISRVMGSQVTTT